MINESVQRASVGTQLADDAGNKILSIIESIHKVAGIVNEINQSGNEQMTGVSQIGEAVDQLEHMTQQNAALVEEMAAAASLHSQADELVNEVAAFKTQR